jgi:cell division protein FtsW
MLNVFTVLGLAPLTGVPLPFISYGSTNLIVLLVGMGVLLNVASGGNVKLRAVPDVRGSRRDATNDPDRGRRDGRARGSSAGGRRRAAG